MRFRCPNPSCTFVFDTEQIPASVTLLGCPLCRHQFPYQAPEVPAPAEQFGGGGPSDSNPFEDDPESPEEEPELSGGPLINVAPPRGTSSLFASPVMLALFSLLVVGGLVTAYLATQKGILGPDRPAPHTDDRFNISFEPPEPPWDRNAPSAAEARKGLNANILAMHRPDPAAWFAMAAEVYDEREPRASELRRKLRDRLESYVKNLQSTEIEGATWAGRDAIGYYFSGDVNGSAVNGACHAITYRGIAYWFFAWAPQGKYDALRGEFADLRGRVKLLDGRKDWRPSRQNLVTFSPEKGDYQVRDAEGVWERPEGKPSDYCPDATIVLRSKTTMKRHLDFLPATAEVLVREVPGAPDALEAARQAVRERLQNEAGTGTVSLEKYDEPLAPDIPKPETPVLRLVASNSIDSDQRYFIVVAVLDLGDQVIVAEARCEQWRFREHWEPYLIQIAGSLSKK